MLPRRATLILICAAFLFSAATSGATAAKAVMPTPTAPVEAAILGLRTNPPMYNAHRGALVVTAEEQAAVVAAINAAQTPIYMAIVPSSSGKPSVVIAQIYAALKLPGTYLTIVETTYETYSTLFDVQPLLTRAFTEQRENGTAAVLIRFAELVGQQAHGTLPPPDAFEWVPALVFVGAVVILGLGYLLWRRAANRRSARITGSE